MRHEGDIRRVNIEVEPLDAAKQTAGLLLISFHEQPNPSGEALNDARTRAEKAEPELLRQLEQELETTRDDLQGTIEEMESANEELKASNEEVMSMNEELQSANEELETSKEELQSLNEELSTVNSQLHDKVDGSGVGQQRHGQSLATRPTLRPYSWTPAFGSSCSRLPPRACST